jgi:dTDP-L-rhamnose 4-epimerase
VFEDGRQQRDFVHVTDVARANLLAVGATAYGPAGSLRSFNVASGHPHTVGEMAEALAGEFGGGLVPYVTGEFRLGDVRHIMASPAAAEQDLGFRAQVPFADGVREFARAELRASARVPAALG